MTIRTLSIVAALVLMLALFGGCRANTPNDGGDSTSTTTTAMQTTTTTADNDLTGSSTTDANSNNNGNNNGASSAITAEQAQQFALDAAGLTANDVTGLRAELERDDGRVYYDVQFYVGNTEYDYDIDANTGAVLEQDRDIEN